GEMSLVGPRPCLPKEFDLYHSPQHHRFGLPPGITGLWQVSRTESTTFGEMVKMDGEYVERLALWRDWQILLKTPYSLFLQTTTLTGFRLRAKASPNFFASDTQETSGG
ncbi:MAG: sugar transferase, partial [Verrucomicrobiota bacterium]